jgi:hypothetical protein
MMEEPVSVSVSVDNFVRAETARMFAALARESGGVNTWYHSRLPAPVEHQTVIRMNRDTLYSSAVVDISEGATITIPDAGDRYLSVMVVNEDHYINRVFHDSGDYGLTVDEFDTPYVGVAARLLADPGDSDDLAEANALQDRFALRAGSKRPFELPDYDQESFDRTRTALLQLAAGGLTGAGFGKKSAVDPVHHLIGTAAGWGGLPPEEAHYVGVFPDLPADAAYKLTVGAVPVDGFWSVSVYNADGYFEVNERNAYSINNITATPDVDGSVTVHFGGCDEQRPNCIPIMNGWNYTVRLYRPRPEVLDGTWKFPTSEPVKRA